MEVLPSQKLLVDISGLRKLKKDIHQDCSQLPPKLISISPSELNSSRSLPIQIGQVLPVNTIPLFLSFKEQKSNTNKCT